jgi:phage baseplate assembly protein W
MTDIQIDNYGEPVNAANKDVLLISDDNELLQDIKMEAKTAEGDCFYDSEYGWSLLDFLQAEIDDLTILEIQQRIKDKLKKHTEINQQTVNITITEKLNIVEIKIRFRMITSDADYELDVTLDRINAEVV